MRRCWVVLSALIGLTTLMPPLPANSFLKKSLADWRRDLDKGDKQAKRSAAFALGRIGAGAAFALPDLARVMRRDSDEGVRETAACAIGDIVLTLPHDRPQGDGEVAVNRPDGQWREVGQLLQDALVKDESPRVRRSAAYALGSFGDLATPALEALQAALNDKAASVRQNAAWALGRVSTTPAVVAALCDRLTDDNTLVRRDAAFALGELGDRLGRDRVRAAAQPLLKLITDESDDVVRKTALGALATLADGTNRQHGPALYGFLAHEDPEMARATAFVLGNMGGESALKALPTLRSALADSDASVQSRAAVTLANAGADAVGAAEDLARVLTKAKHPQVRRNCAIALGRIAQGLWPKQLSQLESLATSAMPALVEAIQPASGGWSREVEDVRRYAAESIFHLAQPNNPTMLRATREVLPKDGNRWVRQSLIAALFECRELERSGLAKVLEKILDETSEDHLMVRYNAARVLARELGERAPDKVCDLLVQMMNTAGQRIRYGSGAAIEGAATEGAGGDSKATESLGGDARYLAAQALEWLGAKARNNKEVMAALRKAATDPEPTLRETAQKTLKSLER